MSTITSANAKIWLAVAGIFPTAVQLQEFAVDDVFDAQPLAAAEAMMGVDGKLAAGYVNVPVEMGFALMANSGSIDFFDTWYLQEKVTQDKFAASGTILLSGLGRQWALVKGFLRNYPAIPDAKRVLQPRKFAIVWESIIPSPSA